VTTWVDIVSRARGLSTHLLTHSHLATLASEPDVPSFAARLVAFGALPAVDEAADPAHVEESLRRRAAARLRVLARWAGPRRGRLSPIFLDQDRLVLRQLLRATTAGLAAEARTAGLIATPALPMRAIDQLAGAGDVATIGALLLAWRHPFGRLVSAEAMRQRPDLLHLEMALVRGLAESARGADGDPSLRRFVRRTVDVENAWAARALATGRADLSAADLFVEGGELIGLDDIAGVLSARSCDTLAARMHMRAPGSAPDVALSPPAWASAEDAVLDSMIREARADARREPLGLAPVILLVLRSRAELQALQRALWSIVLRIPRASAAERADGRAA